MAWSLDKLFVWIFLVTYAKCDSVPYYGVPVGSLLNGVNGVRGDVFVSDKKTIIVPNFGYEGKSRCKVDYLKTN